MENIREGKFAPLIWSDGYVLFDCLIASFFLL